MHYRYLPILKYLLFFWLIACTPALGVQPSRTLVPAQPGVISPSSTVQVGPAITTVPLTEMSSPTPPPVVKGGGTVTRENAQSGVTLHVGERFLLDLGDSNWQVSSEDESIVQLSESAGIPVGSQGYYVAHKAGQDLA